MALAYIGLIEDALESGRRKLQTKEPDLPRGNDGLTSLEHASRRLMARSGKTCYPACLCIESIFGFGVRDVLESFGPWYRVGRLRDRRTALALAQRGPERPGLVPRLHRLRLSRRALGPTSRALDHPRRDSRRIGRAGLRLVGRDA